MAYAIIEAGGRQWKVEPGTRLEINRLPVEVGKTHTVDRVLLTSDGQHAHVGRPYVPGVTVTCEVLEHRRGPKTVSYYFRRRENWRKTIGHRQPMTRLRVMEIVLPATEAVASASPAITATPRSSRVSTKKTVPKPAAKTTTKTTTSHRGRRTMDHGA